MEFKNLKSFNEFLNEQPEINESIIDEANDKWVTPFTLQWKYKAPGIYDIIIRTENGKKEFKGTLSDSMPNDMAKLNKLLLNIISFIEKQGKK